MAPDTQIHNFYVSNRGEKLKRGAYYVVTVAENYRRNTFGNNCPYVIIVTEGIG
jgi:hypothetical protein